MTTDEKSDWFRRAFVGSLQETTNIVKPLPLYMESYIETVIKSSGHRDSLS